MKVYIDTCVFSRLLDLRISDKELDALNSLCDDESIEFITSEKTLDEFLNTKNDKRRKSLRVLFRLITKPDEYRTPNFEELLAWLWVLVEAYEPEN